MTLIANRDALARAIWNASRADEGTISYAGANNVADALIGGGVVIDAGSLAVDDGLVSEVADAVWAEYEPNDAERAITGRVLAMLDAALAERSNG